MNFSAHLRGRQEFALVTFAELSSLNPNRCTPTQQDIPEGGDGRPERRRLGRERKSRDARDKGEHNNKLHCCSVVTEAMQRIEESQFLGRGDVKFGLFRERV